MEKKILLISTTALLAIVVAGYALSIPLLSATQAQEQQPEKVEQPEKVITIEAPKPANDKQISPQIPPEERHALNKTSF